MNPTELPLVPPREALPPARDLRERLAASPQLVALDIDGTLAPIAPTPERAIVPDAVRRTLEQLARLPNVYLVFVTGRAAGDGRRLVGVSSSWTIGNHGIEVIDPDGGLRVNPSAEAYASEIARAAEALRAELRRFEGVFVEDKTWTLSVHFRLAKPKDVPEVRRVLAGLAQPLGLGIFEGKKIFELRPPIATNKGAALLELATSLGLLDHGVINGSALYAGDDRTDEDAFRALRSLRSSAVTIHVGTADLSDGGRTTAEFMLDDPAAMHKFLEWLASTRGAASARA